MALTPKHSAVIYVLHNRVKLFFARPVDVDVLQSIKQICLNEGIEMDQSLGEQGQPWVIFFSPVYDPKDVGFEVEEVLRRHGICNLSIMIDEVGTTREIKTLRKSDQS